MVFIKRNFIFRVGYMRLTLFVQLLPYTYIYRREFIHKILFSDGVSCIFSIKMCFASHVADFTAK